MPAEARNRAESEEPKEEQATEKSSQDIRKDLEISYLTHPDFVLPNLEKHRSTEEVAHMPGTFEHQLIEQKQAIERLIQDKSYDALSLDEKIQLQKDIDRFKRAFGGPGIDAHELRNTQTFWEKTPQSVEGDRNRLESILKTMEGNQDILSSKEPWSNELRKIITQSEQLSPEDREKFITEIETRIEEYKKIEPQVIELAQKNKLENIKPKTSPFVENDETILAFEKQAASFNKRKEEIYQWIQDLENKYLRKK
ncbi:MAG TPA: hypothetical protein VJA22_01800 [Patescibacteria group bacterium]|nr:hypothetical protein [Patescibacteria group bacterium]